MAKLGAPPSRTSHPSAYAASMSITAFIINEVAAKHPDVLSEPHGPWAKVVTLNESSVDIQSRVWCKPEHYWDVMFDLKKSIKEAFDKNNITIPYPTSIELDG